MENYEWVNSLPLLSQDSVVPTDVYENALKIVELVKSEYHNKVTGVWLLSDKDEDGNTCIVLRAEMDRSSYEYLELQHKISRIFSYENLMIYDFNTNVVEAQFGTYIREEMKNAVVIYVK